jgi:hypothetical protein
VQGQVQVQVRSADVRRDTGRDHGDEQARHRAADDREMPSAERAAERPQNVRGDPQQPGAHRVVVVACPDPVIWHG